MAGRRTSKAGTRRNTVAGRDEGGTMRNDSHGETSAGSTLAMTESTTTKTSPVVAYMDKCRRSEVIR